MRRVAVLVVSLTALSQTTAPAAHEARVDAVFARWTAATPGCAAGVAVDGRPVLARAYGMADLEHDVRITPYAAQTRQRRPRKHRQPRSHSIDLQSGARLLPPEGPLECAGDDRHPMPGIDPSPHDGAERRPGPAGLGMAPIAVS